jgi:hypothetical protein
LFDNDIICHFGEFLTNWQLSSLERGSKSSSSERVELVKLHLHHARAQLDALRIRLASKQVHLLKVRKIIDGGHVMLMYVCSMSADETDTPLVLIHCMNRYRYASS